MHRKKRRSLLGPLFRIEHEVRPVVPDYLKLDDRKSPVDHSQPGRCCTGKVENSSIDVGPPVIDPHANVLPIQEVDDSDHTP